MKFRIIDLEFRIVDMKLRIGDSKLLSVDSKIRSTRMKFRIADWTRAKSGGTIYKCLYCKHLQHLTTLDHWDLHKWLMAPKGTGLLCVRCDRIASTWPLCNCDGRNRGNSAG
jgi:hypothetical protein